MGIPIGVDEVGRGSWAGPLLVIAARFLCCWPEDIRDSKLMTKRQRESMFEELLHAFDFGEGWVTPREIDSNGLAKALKIGAARALKKIEVHIEEEIAIDGNINYLPRKYKDIESIVRGDNYIPTISAASIYGKVIRDSYMTKLNTKYPAYYFNQNYGYGTKLHQHAIKSYGAIKNIHRFSYSPIMNINRE